MRTITPHLWFDKEAREAAELYVSLFPDSRITSTAVVRDTPSGDCDILSFDLSGCPFMAINAGPFVRINPSISFMAHFDPSKDAGARARLDAAWERLTEGGKVLMPLDSYAFSDRYGWLQDRYGVSWQLIQSRPGGEERPFIIPTLMFTGAVAGRAEEAIEFYLSVFKDGGRGTTARYPTGAGPDREGTLMYADFRMGEAWLAAMDSAQALGFGFNEAVSLVAPCGTQEAIDALWAGLSADPAAEQCGWLKDKFGVSWQVAPSALFEMFSKGTPAQVARVTQAFLKMKKFDLAALQRAFDGSASGRKS